MPGIGPIHPGRHLAEMLEELEITQYRLARTVGVPPRRIIEIVHGGGRSRRTRRFGSVRPCE